MAEYIKKDIIEKFIKDGLNNPDKSKAFGHDAIEVLEEIYFSPAADVVEVVRCKDCKYYENMQGEDGGGLCKFWLDWLLTEDWFPTEENGFCSNGERREENG